MKKLLYVGLVTFATLSLPSCGDKTTSTETATSDSVATAPIEPAIPSSDSTAVVNDTAATTAVDSIK